MSIQSKILLINFILALLVTVGFAVGTDTFPGNGFFLMLSFITGCGAAGCIVLGLLLLLRKEKSAAKGYLASGVVFIILSAISYLLLQQY